MPHATGTQDDQSVLDDQLIQQTLDNLDGVLLPEQDRELDIGDKADDAVDFADLSDDDLADDEDAGDSLGGASAIRVDEVAGGAINDGETGDQGGDGTDFDDLFGEDPSLPFNGLAKDPLFFGVEASTSQGTSNHQSNPIVPAENQERQEANGSRPIRDVPKRVVLSKEEQEQRDLFAMSAMGSDIVPQPVENAEELLTTLWPKFKRDTIPYFMELIPGRRMRYQGKDLPRPPKPLQITRLSLELAQDQERSFRLSSGAGKRTQVELERAGIIAINGHDTVENVDNDHVDSESEIETSLICGISWKDLQIACEDWDVASLTGRSDSPEYEREDEQDHAFEWPLPKRRKMFHSADQILQNVPIDLSSLHDPEETTAKIAKRIRLDLNDPTLLIDQRHYLAQSKVSTGFRDTKQFGRDALSQGLSRRFNISNDEAYDLLKENHQQKIRGTLGHQAIEHSLPALRLQWPFYKTKLEKQEARSFHRPSLKVKYRDPITFTKPHHIRRKLLKGKAAHDIYAKSEDLSLGDNSTLLLLEYSEEHPAIMSNLGMGSRVINYYRRKTTDDSTRPKLDIGEPAVLMPQDKSPFSLFGHIDPGETTPALLNAMYKAPIFPQDAKSTDFLMIRSSTGVDGPKWYMRNIDNLRVVGQEFPSVDIPGPHSRKVTTASKSRLKMISYRLVRRNKSHRINVGEVTKHFIDTNDMQNRQKMKEFMQFDKEYKEWRMRPGDVIPTEDAVRTMVKPEDVCLLESMQVGQQHLQDSGFSKDDGESDDDDAKEGQNIEQLLAPWSTSKNFIHATQGKAMLELHGEGDPSGRGEAFSFIKTSMKGGFRAMGESVEEKLQGKRLKENNGHGYNVQRQQQQYDESIRRIWEAQKRGLSSAVDTSEHEIDEEEFLENLDTQADTGTPRSETRTPGTSRRQEEETASQSTHFSSKSQAGKILEITRQVRDKYGNDEINTETVRNPRVIRMYLKRKHEMEAATTRLDDLVGPTGEKEVDKRHEKFLQKELSRLERNKERRQAREKQKGIRTDGADEVTSEVASPGAPATSNPKTANTGGTHRKCANCGQVGHIKTNKKLCPMLNGTIKPEEGFSDNAFTASAPIL